MRWRQAIKEDAPNILLTLSLMWMVPGPGWGQVVWAFVAGTCVRAIARREARRG